MSRAAEQDDGNYVPLKN